MNTQEAVKTASSAIQNFGSVAHSMIDAWRAGGERLAQAAKSQWTCAFEQSSPQLSQETRENATHAQNVVAGYYNHLLQVSASGASTVVDTLTGVALAAVERAGTWSEARPR